MIISKKLLLNGLDGEDPKAHNKYFQNKVLINYSLRLSIVYINIQ